MKYLLLLLLFLWSCSDLPFDETPSPIDNNLWTAELKVCGQQSLGLNGCTFGPDTNLEKNYLEFLAYSKGTYTVRSAGCNYEYKARHSKTRKVRISLAKLLRFKPPGQLTCLFNIMLRPDKFDKSYQGQFLLVDGEDLDIATPSLFGTTFEHGVGWLQVRSLGSRSTAIEFDSDTSGTVYWQGCGISKEKAFDGPFVLTLDELLNGRPMHIDKSCLFSLVLDNDDGPAQLFSFNLIIFSGDILSVPDPEISWEEKRRNKGELCIKVSKEYPLLSIDDEYKIKRTRLCSKFARGHTATVRVATANGRFTILSINEGDIVWRPLLIY